VIWEGEKQDLQWSFREGRKPHLLPSSSHLTHPNPGPAPHPQSRQKPKQMPRKRLRYISRHLKVNPMPLKYNFLIYFWLCWVFAAAQAFLQLWGAGAALELQ